MPLPDCTVLTHKREVESPAIVTVAISLYNYKKEVIACLDSVKSQTMDQIDLVIVDDRSTDGSPAVARDWLATNGERFNNYLLLRHEKNEGLAWARNTGFSNSRTQFVFVLDADNEIYPRCLHSLTSALENCNASFAYCILEKWGELSGLVNTRFWNPSALQYGNFIDAMVLHRRSAWETVGGYAVDMPVMGWEDFELWFRIAKAGGWGVMVPEILARYRVQRASMLHSVTNPNVTKLWAYLQKKHPEYFTPYGNLHGG